MDLVLLEHCGGNESHLRHGECLADAHTRAGAKWKVSPAGNLFRAMQKESLGIESFNWGSRLNQFVRREEAGGAPY